MLTDELMLLPDCFTANDINAVIDYLNNFIHRIYGSIKTLKTKN